MDPERDFIWSDSHEKLHQLVEKVAPLSAPVLICGPPGSGKTALAHWIHQHSRRKGAVIVVNAFEHAAAVDDALFGTDNPQMVSADGGTLVIDEVDGLTERAQSRLIGFLKTGELLVGRKTRRLDVRIIATSGERLMERVEAGWFREDLLYRLSVIPVLLPSLS